MLAESKTSTQMNVRALEQSTIIFKINAILDYKQN